MPTLQTLATRGLALLATISLLAGCGLGNEGKYEAFGDGELPLEQRQPIEEYIDTVVPAYGAFMAELATEVGEQLYISDHTNMHCYDLTEFSLYTANTLIPKALPVERVRQIGDAHFTPLGLDHVSTHSGDDLTSIYWHDPENGGWVAITIGPRLTADAVSGIRPGTLTDDQCVNFTSEWEKHFPPTSEYWDLLDAAESAQSHTPQSTTPPQSGN